MTVLIDSWAWIEYFQGTEKGRIVKGYIDSDDKRIISSINVAEVFRHLLSKVKMKDAEEAVEFMLGTSFAIPVSVDIAKDAARIKHEKKWGLGDSIILATAKSRNATIVTGDADFRSESNVAFVG